jgi:hypothetical protein
MSDKDGYYPNGSYPTTERKRASDNDIEEVYLRKDVADEKFCRIEERCSTHDKRMDRFASKQDATDKKISATLVFAIVTLISIIVAIASRALI